MFTRRMITSLATVALAGVALGGCSMTTAESTSPSTVVPTGATPSNSAQTSGGEPSYCAQLRTAWKLKPSGMSTPGAGKAYGEGLNTAAASAQADGDTKMANYLSTLGAMNIDPLSIKAEQAKEMFEQTQTFGLQIKKECNFDILQ